MDKVGGDASGDKVAGGSGWERPTWASLKRIGLREAEKQGRIVFCEGG